MAKAGAPRVSAPQQLVTLGLALLCAVAGPAAAQNCGCQPNVCCSKFGYCGTTDEYCGDGCQSGPCRSGGGGSSSGGGGANVASVVTGSFFNGIKSQAGNGCEGKNFYTRSAFLSAVKAYPGFAHGGSAVQGKREIAAFFAHATHETAHGVVPQGFGATTRAINGALECGGNNPAQMNARVGYYRQYCRQLGVDPGPNLTC
uniref:chitinase n=1 Tax=Zea mays subsp. parviglumis TaxID=76912 RepID=B8QV70_ZEAMP|nr:chitinase [Zea mays subsp. parviglumis]